MIQIDNNRISETVCADKPFVCCFINDNNTYKCFVHTVSPSKKLYEIEVDDKGVVGEPKELDYNVCWCMLSDLCQSETPNSKQFRYEHAIKLPLEWKLVDSSMLYDENMVLPIKEFLLGKLEGELCEFKTLPDCLGYIDGEIELNENE